MYFRVLVFRVMEYVWIKFTDSMHVSLIIGAGLYRLRRVVAPYLVLHIIDL